MCKAALPGGSLGYLIIWLLGFAIAAFGVAAGDRLH
jgi:hypothetical protein